MSEHLFSVLLEEPGTIRIWHNDGTITEMPIAGNYSELLEHPSLSRITDDEWKH